MSEAPERLLDLAALVRAHEAVIHEDRVDAVADRLAQEERRDGGIDAAGERADDRTVGRLEPDRLHLLAAEGIHRPLRRHAADAEEEVLQDLRAVIGVPDFRMECSAVEPPIRRSRTPRSGSPRSRPVTRNPAGGETIVSPWLIQTVWSVSSPEKRAESPDTFATAAAVLPPLPAGHFAAGRERHPLHPVAEPEHGHAEAERVRRRLWGPLLVNALRPAREDDPGGAPSPDLLRGRGGREGRPRRRAPRGCAARSAACTGHPKSRTTMRSEGGLTPRSSSRSPPEAPRGWPPAARAIAAPRKGASATRSGATSAPGASRPATRSPTKTTSALAARKSSANAGAEHPAIVRAPAGFTRAEESFLREGNAEDEDQRDGVRRQEKEERLLHEPDFRRRRRHRGLSVDHCSKNG